MTSISFIYTFNPLLLYSLPICFFLSASAPISLSENAYRLQYRGVVRVIQGHSKGTGTLISMEGCKYSFILTSRHVLSGSKPVEVQLGSLRVKPLLNQWLPTMQRDLGVIPLNRKELALLESNKSLLMSMPVSARKSNSSNFLVSIGYPVDSSIHHVQGRILRSLSTPLIGGYDLVITHNLQQGMSGGPLLDENGNLLGLNSLHSRPAWDAILRYETSIPVSSHDAVFYESSSMAISVHTLRQTLISSSKSFCF